MQESILKILDHYPIEEWQKMALEKGVTLEIIDLRDHEWIVDKNVIIERKNLAGDLRGKVEINLKNLSEFNGHKKSALGYYGADYNVKETNYAHDGINNIYSVSRSVLEADIFINLPKLKTHKKSGITCCLKNLVGVNTYKNYLPHYFIKQYLLINPFIARIISPFFRLGKAFFGETKNIIRSGNWHGNDTLWRMILDLNKVVFYSQRDGTLREEKLTSRKRYIGIVDAILCGEKDGPKSPEPKHLGYLIYGTNPLAIDATAAKIMNFNPLKIPVIEKAFGLTRYKIVDFEYKDIIIQIDGQCYPIQSLPIEFIKNFEPHFGWKNLVETV